MIFSVQRKLCQIRRNSYSNFTKAINRQFNRSKGNTKEKEVTSAVAEAMVPSLSYKCLVKPLIFTATFSGSCFVAATIWQYEEMRKFAQRFYANKSLTKLQGVFYKRSEWRTQMNSWWNSQTQGQKVASVIIALNLGVFFLWKIPALHPFMTRYFTSAPALSGSCLPMFLSTFSHHSFFHLAANMLVLYSFSTPVVSFYGKEQFVALYCSAGVISSFVSYVYKIASRRMVISLGASGALMAVLSSMCCQFPETPLQIVFLPFFSFSAGNAIKGLMALDLVGLIAKWKLFDHAAHLGGATFGIIYLFFGRQYLWDKREKLFLWYHNIREKNE